LEAGRIHDQHHARPVDRHQAFGRPKSIRLVGQNLIGSRARAAGQHVLTLAQRDLFRVQGIVGPVKVVDQECKRGGIGADEAAHDLSLAADLDGGHDRDQQRDDPDADRPPRCSRPNP
jgi:hypothetical protein